MPTVLLIVDDSPLVRRVVSDSLRSDFECVVHASDGLEAIGAVESHLPDLILLDLEMPRLDGLGACRTLRSMATLRHVPIIMLTSRDSDDDVRLAYDAGATDYIVKPFTPSQLRARMRTWMLRRVEAG